MNKDYRIYNGDCINVMQNNIDDNSIDLILTSPPYNIGLRYDNYNDNLPYDEYIDWCEAWLKECFRVLKDDGRIAIVHYLSMGNSVYKYSPIATLNNLALNIGFNHNAIAVWTDATRRKTSAWGSWLSASSPYINTPYEGILIMYKNQWKKKNAGKSTISKQEFLESVGGVWNIAPSDSKIHPATFPIKLANRVINLLSYESDIILDPFAGSGTTILSGIINNRFPIGIDISQIYCELMIDSCENLIINNNLFDEE